jgi:hypothetical protein
VPRRPALDSAPPAFEPAEHSIAGGILLVLAGLTLAGWLFILWAY